MTKAFEFQSTPPVRGATMSFKEIIRLISISIHAPRAGGDVRRSLIWPKC